MSYWMLDFTEEERKKISLIESKETLTEDETDLLERWNAASIAHTESLLESIQTYRNSNVQNIINRAYLLAEALSSLENLADFYSNAYKATLKDGDIEDEQEQA